MPGRDPYYLQYRLGAGRSRGRDECLWLGSPPRRGHDQKHHLPWRVNAARKRNQELAAASTPAPRGRPPTRTQET